MPINWLALRRHPATYLLLLGTTGGYGLLIALAGNQPIAWVGGGVVSTVMVSQWLRGYRILPALSTHPHNLLNANSFQQRLDLIQAQAEPSSPMESNGDRIWQAAKRLAIECQTFAFRICEREPRLSLELLETLHTVIHLAEQVYKGLTIQAQLKMPKYQQMAKQQLQQSCDRLQQTHQQLQQLQDQMILATLPLDAPSLSPSLETLIAANKQILDSHVSLNLISPDPTTHL